jgi:hypothetical protein
MAVIEISDNKQLPPIVKIVSGGVATINKIKITQLTF